ncbi:MAG: hypothetical protein U0228_26610 [Myxococcaceae bacterium]
MSDELTTKRLAELRQAKAKLEGDVRRQESQVAALEKRGASTDEAEAKLGTLTDELDRVTAELEQLEEGRAEQQQATDELERLVDSFQGVAAQVPELAELLAAMRLCLGALATARRLEQRDESLHEAKEISKALSEALLRLASTLSTRTQVLNQLPLPNRGRGAG